MELRVEFCGDEYLGATGRPLSFGRQGDIVIDSANRYLHRIVGSFHRVERMWWLSNDGSAISLTLADADSAAFVRVVPGTAYPVAFESSVIRFDAGGASYEIDVALIDLPARWGPHQRVVAEIDTDELGAATASPNDVVLSDEQQQLLVALSRPLLDAGATRPTNRQLAHQLGWTITKYNRKLDGLCQKFANAGVGGLHGSTDLLAKDRRWRLAAHAVETGLVSETSGDPDQN